jgi:microcystin degradation protein MlrC
VQIAVGGIASESCTFSPLPTQREDFDVLRGAALLARYPYLSDFEGVTFIPLFHASALPGGPVERAAYEQFKGEFLDQLRAQGPWDGVYLDMHGALYVQGMEDAEGDLIAAVRQAVGPDCMIAASYDLHGNLSQRVVDNLDLVTAYRTAPHVDGEETRQRACKLLVNCLQMGIHPHMAFIPVPLLLPGERATTDVEPGASLYRLIPQVVQNDDVLDASILVGYTWADEPRAGASVVAVGTEPSAVRQAALRLAWAYWDRRREFRFSVPTGTVDECIQWALNVPESGLFISDSGDNVTGGGVGDVPYVLGRLIALDVPSAIYASIVDPTAVGICFRAGIGANVNLSLGGKLDTIHGEPLDVSGQVIALETPEPGNRQAVLQIDAVKAVITERRTAFTVVKQFQRLGLNLLEHKIVSVKLGYLFPDLRRIAPRALMALSPGAIYARIEELPFERVARPIHPLDPDMTWRPNRGVSLRPEESYE